MIKTKTRKSSKSSKSKNVKSRCQTNKKVQHRSKKTKKVMNGGGPPKYRSGPNVSSYSKSRRKVAGVTGLVQKTRGGILPYTAIYTNKGIGKKHSNINLLKVNPSTYANTTMTNNKNNPNLAVLRPRPTINTKIPISPSVASFLAGLQRR